MRRWYGVVGSAAVAHTPDVVKHGANRSGGLSIVVVGGAAKGVGKTALICGMMAAMLELEWTAIKITSHAYGGVSPTKQRMRDPATDTGRYLLAGARKALLVEASRDAELAALASEVMPKSGNVVLESNRIASHLTPNLCIGVLGDEAITEKPSFAAFPASADGLVVRTGVEWPARLLRPGISLFTLDDFRQVSPKFAEWVRARLTPQAREETALF